MKTFKRISRFYLFALIISLFYGCNEMPETYVYLGKNVPKEFIEEVKSLGLLNTDEKIEYFYSDGFNDIKEGLYFVTESKLVAYNNSWEPPKTIILFDDITKLDVEYNESFFEDSFIIVTTNEIILEFPVSSERKRDKAFFNFIHKKVYPSKKKN